jgi:hypothetical protein
MGGGGGIPSYSSALLLWLRGLGVWLRARLLLRLLLLLPS